MLGIGIIGYGYWGPNLVRNFFAAPGMEVVAVSDLREDRLKALNSLYPSIETTTDHTDLFKNPQIDAIAIATPVFTHFDLALQALQAGKHVLVEKPMTATSEQGKTLIEEAEKRGLILMVDHTFIYTGGIKKIKELMDNEELGKTYYYDSTRVNLGLFQHDIDVMWDLAVHDLSILDYVLNEKPVAVSATGTNHVDNTPENIAYLTLFFESQLIAHISVNWLSPVKIRQTLISGDKKMIVYDELEPTEKIKVYDSGIIVNDHSDKTYNTLIDYRTGDMWAPKFDNIEALKAEVIHFRDCIENKKQPLTCGKMGLRIVNILEAATESIKSRGKLVELKNF